MIKRNYFRKKSRKVKIKDMAVGGDAPISIQSLTNTQTKDIKATVGQIKALEIEGVEIIRSAIRDFDDAKAISKIKKEIIVPFISDIQFDYKLALESIRNGTDGLRINPGNIGGKDKVKEIVKACKDYGVPIRIGVNSGSISKDLLEKYHGVNASSLVESAIEEIRILEELDFQEIVISIKASDVRMNIEANREISKRVDYPLHLGVTEAGTIFRGSIKSAIGIGALLEEGIGDTIRISLTSNPIDEIPVAREILTMLGLKKGLKIVSCTTCARTEIDLISLTKTIEDGLKNIDKDLTVAVMGCPVNGPGEAREADYGVAGGKKEALLFKKGEIIKKVKEEDIVSELFDLINGDI